jgi:hypothetical protein
MRKEKCNLCIEANDEVEKIHLINKVLEVQNKPILTLDKPNNFMISPLPPPPGSVPTEVNKNSVKYDEYIEKFKYDEIDEMDKNKQTIEMLKKQGFDTSQVEKKKQNKELDKILEERKKEMLKKAKKHREFMKKLREERKKLRKNKTEL